MTVHKLPAGDDYTCLTRQVASHDQHRQQAQDLAVAIALPVISDALALDDDDRGPGEKPAPAPGAASRLDPDEQAVVRSVIEGLALKHEARLWNTT